MDIAAFPSDFATRDVCQPSSDGRLMQTCASFAGLLSLVFAPGQQLQIQQVAPAIGRMDESTVSLATAPSWNVGDFLGTIKEGWQFNMTEMADVLGVRRPTVYNWLNGKTTPNAEMRQRLQTLAAAARTWKDYVGAADEGFLLDYTGPLANEASIRDHLKAPDITSDELRELIPSRIAQYREARDQARVMLGEAPPFPAASPPKESRRLNELWAENTKAIHAARNKIR